MTDKRRTEKPAEPLSPRALAILSLIQGLLPVMTAIIGGLWVAFTYLEHQKDAEAKADNQMTASEQRMGAQQLAAQQQSEKELRYKLYDITRAIIDQQNTVHIQLSDAVGTIMSVPVSSSEWSSARVKFAEIYWGLFVINHKEIRDAAAEFAKVADAYKVLQSDENRTALENDASKLNQALAHQIGTVNYNLQKSILTPQADTSSSYLGNGF